MIDFIGKIPELIQLLLDNVGKITIAHETPDTAFARQKLTSELQTIMKELDALSGQKGDGLTQEQIQQFMQMMGLSSLEKKP